MLTQKLQMIQNAATQVLAGTPLLETHPSTPMRAAQGLKPPLSGCPEISLRSFSAWVGSHELLPEQVAGRKPGSGWRSQLPTKGEGGTWRTIRDWGGGNSLFSPVKGRLCWCWIYFNKLPFHKSLLNEQPHGRILGRVTEGHGRFLSATGDASTIGEGFNSLFLIFPDFSANLGISGVREEICYVCSWFWPLDLNIYNLVLLRIQCTDPGSTYFTLPPHVNSCPVSTWNCRENIT